MNLFKPKPNTSANHNRIVTRRVFDSVQPRANTPAPPRPVAKKSRFLKILLAFMFLMVFGLGALIYARANTISSKIFVGKTTTFFGQLKGIILGGNSEKLVGEDLGQVNILLLGIGGEGHDGPYLTDTMMLAQIRPDIGAVSLVSIPRDYAVILPENLGERKINSVFAEGFGKYKDFNSAGQWARESVEKISGLSIPYFAVVDFKGFKEAIDQVDGVTIQVDNTFTDSQYPNNTLGYLPPITFKAGTETMNGERALQFARSRHGNNGEGSDFARSKRQKKVIQAFKDKALNLNLITDASKLNSLLEVFSNHFHTNLSLNEIWRLYRLSKDNRINTIVSLSLDPSTKIVCDGSQPETGAYIVFPCPGKTITDVQNFFKNSFALGSMGEEGSVVWLANSTANKKAYQQADTLLKAAGLTVWEVGYSEDNLPGNIFYQVNPKPATAEFLKNILKAKEVTLPPPGMNINKEKVDIIVILGK